MFSFNFIGSEFMVHQKIHNFIWGNIIFVQIFIIFLEITTAVWKPTNYHN